MAISKSVNTVTVACKLPNGLRLRTFSAQEVQENYPGGTRTVRQFMEDPIQQDITGFSYEQNKAPHCQFASGFALTMGVDKDLWEKWLVQNKDTMIVKNGLIFAHSDMASIESEGKEKVECKSGLERLDPNKLPNTSRRITTAKV